MQPLGRGIEAETTFRLAMENKELCIAVSLPNGRFYVGVYPDDFLGQTITDNSAMCALADMVKTFVHNGYFKGV